MSPELPAFDAEGADSFRGKVALILGASRGIGAATARVFGRRGAHVLLASRDAPALERVASEIRAAGGSSAVHPTDLGEPGSVGELGTWVSEVAGRLDFAFNNAGEGAPPAPLAEIEPATFERVVRVTVEGTFRAMREEIPLVLRSGGGAIVNMSSTAGVSAYAGGGAYVAAKHAVLGLTKSAALDYGRRGLRVNAVAPGPIATERLQGLPEAYLEQMRAAVPMHRAGLPEEVGAVVAWLCSADAAFVNGATIFVDGGRMAGAIG